MINIEFTVYVNCLFKGKRTTKSYKIHDEIILPGKQRRLALAGIRKAVEGF